MTSTSSTVRAARVLVVEDERHIARLMEFVLRKEGYDVCVAYDGAQALKLAQEHQPDAVLLDLVLPDTSGLDILRQLRNLENLRAIPMALLSARSFEASVSPLSDVDVSFQCTKPVAPSTLIRKLLDHGVPPVVEMMSN